VLRKVAGNEHLHIVKAIRDGRYQIGNNRDLPMGGLDRSASLASASRLIHELCDGRHRISRSTVVGQTLRRRFIITPRSNQLSIPVRLP
jgi:hypothetical protein